MKPLLLLALLTTAAFAAKDSCVECHSALDGALQAPAAKFSKDVHAHAGFSCADCHGGDRTADDPEASMSRAKGFIGKPARTAVPKLCARCHGDATVMHRFKPQQRVDQLTQYQTSIHGQRLATGDDKVAECVDCHGVHEIREVKDALSPVHPLHLPETCARCHADKQHMAPYKLQTDQFSEYRQSVHWRALSQRGDLSAPSCASCHGNHGATPPQVSSVAAVCGTCHVLFEDLYNKSPHQASFSTMGGCTVCHSNHGIRPPSDAMLAGDKAVCTQCHEASSEGGQAAARMASLIQKLDTELAQSDLVLNRAHADGMEISEALMRQMEGRENLVKARVAVHAFRPAAVEKPVNAGLAIAAETRRAGEQALRERDHRRVGLGVSLLFIVVTMFGLRLAIRSMERKPQAAERSAGG